MIVTTTDQQDYDALLAEADRIGWPERFRTDLTEHDRLALSRRRSTEAFAWVLSRDATYLVFPSRLPIDGAGHYAHEMRRSCREAFGAENCRWYWWDGAQLTDARSPEALAEHLRCAAGADRQIAEG